VNDRTVESWRGSVLVSTDRTKIEVDNVLAMLHASHWGAGMERSVLVRAIENSVCVGAYDGGRQVGFLRAVTDLATYAYLTDVYVDVAARGKGVGSHMLEVVVAHPDLQGLRRFTLFTRNARTLYERFGFAADMPLSSTYMEKRGRSAPSSP
jgi:ribosomal protein S18 acetylase RimI-like enzyme